MALLRKPSATSADHAEESERTPLAIPELAEATRATVSELKVYEVHQTEQGPQLRRLDLGRGDSDPRKIEFRLMGIGKCYAAYQDAGVAALLAAGSACNAYLEGKFHKKIYGTREAFAEQCFGASDRTVRDWIDAYELWEEIGGLTVPLPTRIYQLTVIGKIKPAFRKRAWTETAKANDNKSASGADIYRWAERHDALIESVPKKDSTTIPDVPLTGDFEATLFIANLSDQATRLKHLNLATALGMLAAYIQSRSGVKNPTIEPTKLQEVVGKSQKQDSQQLDMFDDTAITGSRETAAGEPSHP